MPQPDPDFLAHREWIDFVGPTGLVVSATALVRANAGLDRRDIEGQGLLRACTRERTFAEEQAPAAYLPEFVAFARTVLEWSFDPRFYAGGEAGPVEPELE